MPDLPGWIITVTPTIMSGTVVRWFASVDDAEHFRPFLSASRYEVITHIEGVVTPALRDQVNVVHEALVRDDYAAVRPLETHRRRGLTGPMKEVTHA